MHFEPPAITFNPGKEHFRPVLPTIKGNVDYLALRGRLTTMDEHNGLALTKACCSALGSAPNPWSTENAGCYSVAIFRPFNFK
jgi:hypothetical protein